MSGSGLSFLFSCSALLAVAQGFHQRKINGGERGSGGGLTRKFLQEKPNETFGICDWSAHGDTMAPKSALEVAGAGEIVKHNVSCLKALVAHGWTSMSGLPLDNNS